jgi:hypothetical protein
LASLVSGACIRFKDLTCSRVGCQWTQFAPLICGQFLFTCIILLRGVKETIMCRTRSTSPRTTVNCSLVGLHVGVCGDNKHKYDWPCGFSRHICVKELLGVLQLARMLGTCPLGTRLRIQGFGLLGRRAALVSFDTTISGIFCGMGC